MNKYYLIGKILEAWAQSQAIDFKNFVIKIRGQANALQSTHFEFQDPFECKDLSFSEIVHDIIKAGFNVKIHLNSVTLEQTAINAKRPSSPLDNYTFNNGSFRRSLILAHEAVLHSLK